MVVAHIDCSNGRGSIADLIQDGRVVSYDGTSFEKVEQIYWALYYGKIRADLVVLDELSTLVDRFVRQVTLPDAQVDGISKTWNSMIGKMRQNQDIWNIVNFGIGQVVTGIRNLPIPSVFAIHERERDDPTADVEVDRHMPALTPKILLQVMSYSDLVMRLFKSPGPVTVGGVNYPPNTRILQLENNANAYTGVRLTPAVDRALPPYIAEPTLEKLAQAIGHLPKAMTVYGFPKVGKTVFCATLPQVVASVAAGAA